jgi:hypothetical protein
MPASSSRRARIVALCFGLIFLAGLLFLMAQPRPVSTPETLSPDTPQAEAE